MLLRRASGLLAVPLLAASLLGGAAPASAQGTLDQSQPLFTQSSNYERIGQTFTAGRSGRLVGVSLVPGFPMPGVTVQIRSTSAGVPTDTVLASSTITSSAYSAWADVTFASPAIVVAGVQYAIVLPAVGMYGVTYDAYARGIRWLDDPWYDSGWEMAFKTFVDSSYGFAWKSPTKGKGDGVNRPRAGTTVPVTFTLDTRVRVSKLLPSGWPKVRRVECSTGKPKAGTEWMSRPLGAKGLSRDGDLYTYSWRVRPEWGVGALACRELRFKLTDGTTHSALYRFRPAR